MASLDEEHWIWPPSLWIAADISRSDRESVLYQRRSAIEYILIDARTLNAILSRKWLTPELLGVS